MIQKLLLNTFLFVSLLGVSQVQIPANTRADLIVLQNSYAQHGKVISAEMRELYPINNIHGIDYVSFLGKVSSAFQRIDMEKQGIICGTPINAIVSLKIPVENLSLVSDLPGIELIQLAGKIAPSLDHAVHDIGADSVQQGINLPTGYTGKNVLIGVTDWGFDYSSPMFYDTLLQTSRIVAAWDQFKTAGPAPSGFSYGTEYTTPSELVAAQCDTANQYSYATHGTHVCGIAGGSGAGTIYRGIAFDAQFLMTTMLVDESAALDAWQWLYEKSQELGKRLVVNMSWGLYHFGTMDGNSLLSQAIDGYSALGVVFSNSGGNNGNVNFHLKKQFANDSVQTRIQFYSYSANQYMWGQSIHAWGEQGNSFSNGIDVYSNGVIAAQSPYYSTATTATYVDTFLVVGADTIWYNISADAAHPQNGRPQMRLRVKCTNTNLRVILKTKADSGLVHYWNVTEITTNGGNWGMPFSNYGTNSLSGDNLYGISEPACTNSLISVAAYAPRYYVNSTSQIGGAIASFSSIGPRYDEVLKPEIAAPGVSIVSSISSFTDNAYSPVTSVTFNGRTYPFAAFSGTSMAAPMVTGVVAQILEANPYLSAQQIKDIIIETARQDAFTGTIPSTGSSQWGWGKLNAYQAVQLALNTLGIVELKNTAVALNVFPNPATNILTIDAGDVVLPQLIQLIDMNGKVMEMTQSEQKVDVSALQSGVYFVRFISNNRVYQQRFVKQ